MQARIARTTLSRALSAAILGMAAATAMAQEQAATPAVQESAPAEQVTDLDSVVVKGFRQSLQYSTEAKRDFAALGVSNVFYVEMDNGSLNGTSTVGFSLQNSSGTSGLEFYFQGGDSNYTINRNGGEQDSGIGWSNAGLLITITNLTSTTYSMAVTVKGGSTYNFTGTYMNSVSSISTMVPRMKRLV